MDIQEISSKDTLPLRNEILRPGKDVSTCIFEGDDAPTTRHFGAIDEAGNIVGIVSVTAMIIRRLKLKMLIKFEQWLQAPPVAGEVSEGGY